MGTYYMVVCDNRRERIDPFWITDKINPRGGAIQEGPAVLGPLMAIVAAYTIRGRWTGEQLRIVNDTHSEEADGPDWDEVSETYRDVTPEAIQHFIQIWPERAREWGLGCLPPEEGPDAEGT